MDAPEFDRAAVHQTFSADLIALLPAQLGIGHH